MDLDANVAALKRHMLLYVKELCCVEYSGQTNLYSRSHVRWILLPHIILAFCHQHVSAEEIEQICLKHRGAVVSAADSSGQVVSFDRFQRYHEMQEGEKSLLLVEKGDEIDQLKGDLRKESRKRQRAETRVVAVEAAYDSLR